jgi:Tfp pilus assembly protein PilV
LKLTQPNSDNPPRLTAGNSASPALRKARHSSIAFSLIEVMVACGIFFMAVFAVLGLVANTLKNARALRHVEVDAGMAAAMLSKTNRLTEGIETGDFGDAYPDYTWEMESHEHETFTNGLWEVNIVVRRHGADKPVDAMTVWVYSPDSSSLPFNRRP